MRDPEDDVELARRFHESSATHHPRAPLYAALSAGIARDPDLYRLLHHAPPTQRLPVLLFATVHAQLLSEPDHELAQWYPNLVDSPRSPTDPHLLATFKRFVIDREPAVVHMLSTRTTQTNEVGRCLMFLPPLAEIHEEMGPLSLLDIGSSGGLNLLLDKFEYHYTDDDSGDTQSVGATSTVVLAAATRGRVPVPRSLPVIATRCGVDRHPIDITDDGEAHWLEACVWPDQRDRFLRLRAAIDLARKQPPELLAGDAVTSLRPAIERMARVGHTIVMNSWVLNYLTPEQRTAYVAELDRIGASVDLSWIWLEAPELTPELPWHPDVSGNPLSVLSIARWRAGQRSVQHLASCHPHGFWIHWHDGSPT